jgi:hypothetical protein
MGSIDVTIRTGLGSMNMDRPLIGPTMAGGPAEGFQEAAQVLRSLADDIDRMYPPPTAAEYVAQQERQAR